ncbi:MAG: hypothetical protein KDA31_14275 [Phycisphaerales bacterium]|nr:hypothetical protein [Phycisphaerales bacterium]MCB9835524.1 hypothetical protein [Phycisphaera sp.]
MAKRRNAPALFELLRESNSTRTGQIGGEQLRTQLGGGTVKNAAPRPPGHPALKAEQEQQAEADEQSIVASQVASESVVESKSTAESLTQTVGSEVDPLLSMPSFRAGRSVPEKSEPKAVASKTDSRKDESAKPEATQVESIKPEPKAEQSKPEPIPTATVVEAPLPVKPAPENKPKPEAKPEPAKVERTKEPEVQHSPSKPKIPAKNASGQAPEAVMQGEDDTQAEPSPVVTETDSAPERYPLVKRVGNQMTFSTFTVGMIVTAIPVIILIAYLIGTLVGTSTTKRDLEPMLRDQAENGLSGLEGQPGTNMGPNDSEDTSLRDPLNLARDPEFTSPKGVVPENTAPAGQNDQANAQDTGEAAGEPEMPNAVQITNEDTRVDGQNYLHLAPLADPEEAIRLQKFLAENGIKSFIREQYRGGRLGHEIITLVGIASDEWSTSTKKIDHEREVKRLGGIWFRDFGGSIDFSRDNQSVWYKAKIDGP